MVHLDTEASNQFWEELEGWGEAISKPKISTHSQIV